MQPSAQKKKFKTVPFFTSCRRKRQLFLEKSEHIAQSYMWQNDVRPAKPGAEELSHMTKPNAFTTNFKVGPC